MRILCVKGLKSDTTVEQITLLSIYIRMPTVYVIENFEDFVNQLRILVSNMSYAEFWKNMRYILI